MSSAPAASPTIPPALMALLEKHQDVLKRAAAFTLILFFLGGLRLVIVGHVLLAVFYALRWALKLPLPHNPVDLTGKTFLVTGCTPGGIGENVARELLSWNATVVCTIRSEEKADALRQSLAEVGTGKLETVILELTSFDSVRNGAKEIRERFPKFDGILLNAGLMPMERKTTADGFEEMFQVNHLSQFLLLRLLEDRLNESARVTYTSSTMFKLMGILDKDIYGTKPGGRSGKDQLSAQFNTYSDTKLMNVLTANAFARRLAHLGIKVNSVCPGIVKSNFDRYMDNDIMKKINDIVVMRTVGRTSREGALRPLDLLVHTEETGKFFDAYVKFPSRNEALTRENEEWLWEISSRFVGLSAD